MNASGVSWARAHWVNSMAVFSPAAHVLQLSYY
jgi:hypothetical protein